MSPKDRDRAYEKRRYDKHTRVLEQREADRRRNKQVVGVVLAVLLVVGGLVGVAALVGNDEGTPTATPTETTDGPTGTATGTPTASATPTATTVAGCEPPPAVPTASRTATLPDKSLANGATWVATVHTNCGDIVMELDGAKAPQAVSSFITLARTGYWADSPCHRLTGAAQGLYVLQCGDPTGTGSGGPGYGFGVENAPADFTYPRGTLAMARTSDPESNGGQFFIVYQDTVLQDPTGYTVFGKVTKGLDLVDQIAAAGISTTDNTAPNQPISILSVDVEEKKA